MVDFRRSFIALMVFALFAGRGLLAQTVATPTPSPPTTTTTTITPIAQVTTTPGFRVTDFATTTFGNPNNPEYIVVVRLAPSNPSAPTRVNVKGVYASAENQSGTIAPAAKLQTAGLKPRMSGIDTGLTLGDAQSCAATLGYPIGFGFVGGTPAAPSYSTKSLDGQ